MAAKRKFPPEKMPPEGIQTRDSTAQSLDKSPDAALRSPLRPPNPERRI
jgi:hypothetical protein